MSDDTDLELGNEMPTYKIIRFHYDDSHPDHKKVIDEGLSLHEAKEHCSHPDSQVPGVWFDGWTRED